MFVPNTNWMKGKDVSQMQQAKFPLEINGVASNLNQWISDEDQSQEPTWHIEKLIHPCLKLEKEQKKNMAYRSINFWLKIPISYYKQHFVFLSSANEGCILQKSIYVFCWTYYTWVSFIWFFFFFCINKLTILPLHGSLWTHVYLPHCQQVHGSLLKDTFHWEAALRNTEGSVRETRKYVDLKYWRNFTNIMIKVKSVKK